MSDLYLPVNTLKEARKLAQKYDGTYVSLTSLRGKSLLAKSPDLDENINDFILNSGSLTHIVIIPDDTDLHNFVIGDEVYLLGTMNWIAGSSNPFGIKGTVDNYDWDDEEYHVEWDNRESNGAYQAHRDIIRAY